MCKSKVFFMAFIFCLSSTLLADVQNIRKLDRIRAYMIDYDAQTVLFSHNSDVLMFPSSMQKTLLASLTFDYVGEKDPKKIIFTPSKKAASQIGTSMHLEAGVPLSVNTLLQGMLVVSGNDAAVALAEGIFGSEDAAAQAMESRAKEWGCDHTTVRNATGLPNPDQQTTCVDLVTIGQKLFENYSAQWHRFSTKSFSYNGITQQNKDIVLTITEFHVDGIKSGYTGAAGYGAIFTAMKGSRRIFGVINGCLSKKELKAFVEELLTFGFGGKACG